MTTLFLFGTLWFWFLTVPVVVLLAVLSEDEYGYASVFCLAIYAVLLQWMGGVDILGYACGHPVFFVAWIGFYFVVGAFWGILKWYFFVKGRSQRLIDVFREWCRSSKKPFSKPIDGEIWRQFEEDVQGTSERVGIYPYREYRELLTAPLISENKGRFMNWTAFWPFSMAYTICNDAMRKICRQIYILLAERLQAISDQIYAKIRPEISTSRRDK